MNKKMTPMMMQWHRCKSQANDALVFFRLGDFYEAFYQDATVMAKELGLTLTKRQDVPMCGVPVQVADQYLDKLIAKGYKVAIAEQIESAKQTTGIVSRKIVRFLSPGSIIHSRLLSQQSNNFFICIAIVNKMYAMSIIDLSTAEFRVLQTSNTRQFLSEICRLRPAEILVSEEFAKEQTLFLQELSQEFSHLLNTQKNTLFCPTFCKNVLEKQFSSANNVANTFCLSETVAAGALLHYLQDCLYMNLDHIQTVEKDPFTAFMTIDKACLCNLNILPSKESKFSLIDVMDKTSTAMGARLLRHWVKRPLINPDLINNRLDAVDELRQNLSVCDILAKNLPQIRDMERILTRITSAQCSPKDFISLKGSLLAINNLKAISALTSPLLSSCFLQLEDTSDILQMITETFVEDPPFRLHDGPCFCKGYNKTLDELQELSTNSKQWIASYQDTLREELGIKTLKVGYTKVFGYYIEVTKAQASKVPSSFSRRQTLTNAERFLSEELKTFEYKILSAQDRMKALEKTLFAEAKKKFSAYFSRILSLAKTIAKIDVLHSFAKTASCSTYTRPLITKEDSLEIKEGRHPILEKSLGFSSFIPNDTSFTKDAFIHLITGPNMAGKSTYIRQCALLVIMAQTGSFVPAKYLSFRPIKQVFSRIGASDDIANGASTFLLEMQETAAILKNATKGSLVILDEIGRGTSTYDGIAIAWSVIEYLLKKAPAKTLFATHYRELTKLDEQFGVKNFQVAVKEDAYGIVFLHKIILGKAPKSYAIHVAKLAGLPKECLEKAAKILLSLEKKPPEEISNPEKTLHLEETKNLSWIKALALMNLNTMTPIQAHQELVKLQKTLGL